MIFFLSHVEIKTNGEGPAFTSMNEVLNIKLGVWFSKIMFSSESQNDGILGSKIPKIINKASFQRPFFSSKCFCI